MKKNSISREIAEISTKISLSTLGISALLFAVIYLICHDVGYAFVLSIFVGIGVLILLSVTLPIKTAERIAEKINDIDVSSPKSERFYPELEPLRSNLCKMRKEMQKKLSEMDDVHMKQDKMRRDFTANVSHELKTPLTSIKGYSELLRDGVAKDEDVPRFAEKIYDESQRLITLVGDIIKLSQLDGNDIEVKIEKIDLWELTLAVIGHLEMAAKAKSVTVSMSGERAFVTGGEQIVEEMIFNVIDNAIKYNKTGGEVKIKIRQRIDGVELEVSDTGIGISEENLPHIFERFWREDKSHSKEIGGTGLGLSIVKHGAMFMGASVSVKSQVGEGTTMRIVF